MQTALLRRTLLALIAGTIIVHIAIAVNLSAVPVIPPFRTSDIGLSVDAFIFTLIGLYFFTVQPTTIKMRIGCAILVCSAMMQALALLSMIGYSIFAYILGCAYYPTC